MIPVLQCPLPGLFRDEDQSVRPRSRWSACSRSWSSIIRPLSSRHTPTPDTPSSPITGQATGSMQRSMDGSASSNGSAGTLRDLRATQSPSVVGRRGRDIGTSEN